MSKKLQQKQQRRLADEARRAQQRKSQRRANLITIGIALVVVVGVVAAVVVSRTSDSGAGPDVGVSAADARCTDIESNKSEGNKHVDQGITVDYKHNPPVTGNHWPPDAIADPGFYTDPVEPERVVHNQEHGEIVIWYKPDAPQQVIDDIQAIVEQSPQVNIAVPWDDIEAPNNFALTAWSGADNAGNTRLCEQVSQSVWDDFRAQFQGRGPEQVGVPTFTKPSG